MRPSPKQLGDVPASPGSIGSGAATPAHHVWDQSLPGSGTSRLRSASIQRRKGPCTGDLCRYSKAGQTPWAKLRFPRGIPGLRGQKGLGIFGLVIVNVLRERATQIVREAAQSANHFRSVQKLPQRGLDRGRKPVAGVGGDDRSETQAGDVAPSSTTLIAARLQRPSASSMSTDAKRLRQASMLMPAGGMAPISAMIAQGVQFLLQNHCAVHGQNLPATATPNLAWGSLRLTFAGGIPSASRQVGAQVPPARFTRWKQSSSGAAGAKR